VKRREGVGRTRLLGLVALAAAAGALVPLRPTAAALLPLPQPATAEHPHPAARGGAVLDGHGGIHPFGGLVLDTAGAASWPDRDLARSLAVRGDGSGGWVLDGWGGIHAFGSAPPITAPASWPGRDIARALVVSSRDADGLPDGREGYVLDGFGQLHPWGGAPPLDPGPGSPGWDIARGLALHRDHHGRPDGGWILDGYGGVHAFGAAEPLPGPRYYGGRDLYLQLHVAGDVPYTVERWGPVTGLGADLTPPWAGYADWGAWDILRDIVLLDGTGGDGPQPVSAEAAKALRMHADRIAMGVPTFRQTRSLDCEAAALQVALAAVGTAVTQDWIIATIGADTRPPQIGPGRTVARWGDPYATFVGRIDGSEPAYTGYGVYHPPVAAAARAAGRSADGREGWDPWALYDEVGLGHPAVVWVDATFSPVQMRRWTAWDGRSVPYAIGEHAVTIVGVDAVAGTVTLADVRAGIRRTFPMSRFEAFFASFGNMAVVVS
jgi:uncharacterized protein YvpB